MKYKSDIEALVIFDPLLWCPLFKIAQWYNMSSVCSYVMSKSQKQSKKLELYATSLFPVQLIVPQIKYNEATIFTDEKYI